MARRHLAGWAVALPVFAFHLFGSAAPAVGAIGVWSQNAITGGWASSVNWNSGVVPGAASGTTNADTAFFSSPSTTALILPDLNRNLQSISFDTSATAYTIGTANGNGLLLTGGGTIQIAGGFASSNVTETVNAPLMLEGAYTLANNSPISTDFLVFGGPISSGVAGVQNLSVTGSNNVNINGAIADGAGTVGLTKMGAGTLTLAGSNTFTAGLTISSGTVRAGATPAGTTTLGTGTVTLSGGTLALQGQTTGAPGLLGYFYNNAPNNVGNVDPDYNTLQSMSSHLNSVGPVIVTPTSTNGYPKLDYSNSNFGSGSPFGTSPATATQANYGFTFAQSYEIKLTGIINVATAGSYTFRTTSDDGSVLFLDNGNTPVVNNNAYQERTTKSGTISLSPGPHLISVGFYQGVNGNGLLVEYNGPDTGNANVTIPNSVLNVLSNSQSFNNNVSVTADSTIDVAGSPLASFGSLAVNGSVLSTTSGDQTMDPYGVSFTATTLTGNATFNVANSASGGTGKLFTGPISDGGVGFRVIKNGAGTLQINAGSTYSGGTTVTQGTVAVSSVVGANPLGTGPVILAGGSLALQGQATSMTVPGLLGKYYSTSTAGAPSPGDFTDLGQMTAKYSLASPNDTAVVNTPTFNLGTNFQAVANGDPTFNSSAVNFAAIWTGKFNAPSAAGTSLYTFTTSSDDGSVLFIDGQAVVNNLFEQGMTSRSGSVTLNPGLHDITVGFYQHNGPYGCSARVANPNINGGVAQDIPNSLSASVPGLRTSGALASQQSYGNDLSVTANSSIDISGSLLAAMGGLSINTSALTITSPDQTGSPYSLALGGVTLTGNPTLNVNKSSGGGTGTLTLGAFNDGGIPRTITIAGNGETSLASSAVSLISGTQFNISVGATLTSNNPTAMGTSPRVVANGTLNVGASQSIASLTGAGSVIIQSANSFTVGNNENLTSNFTGTIFGSGSLIKSGNGTFTLAGPDSHSGGTTVNGGTLAATNTLALGTGPTALNGGTLQVAPTNVGLTYSGLGGNGAGWTVNNDGISSTPITNNILTLTDNNTYQARSAFLNTPLPIAAETSGFTASFIYQLGGAAISDGVAFILQNDPRGTNALGGNGGWLGYATGSGAAGMIPSVALEMNIYNGHVVGTKLVSNAVAMSYNPTGAVNIASGHPIKVTLSYNPTTTTVTETLVDQSDLSTFTTSYSSFNLPAILGSNTAYVGFSGGSGANVANQTISGFTYSLAGPIAGTYANDVIVNGGASTTIDVAATAANPVITMGALIVNAGAPSTLNVTGGTIPASNQAYGLTLGNVAVNGSITFNVSNNGSGVGTLKVGTLNDGGVAHSITKSGNGVVESIGSPRFSRNTSLLVNQGVLRFNVGSGIATIGTGVTATIASGATLELAGSVSALANGPNRVNIINNSSTPGLLVSGTHQQVGGIEGAGTTQVNAGSDLTANHIIQSALIIGGTSKNPGIVTIDASDAAGNPLMTSQTGALAPTDTLGAGDGFSFSATNDSGPVAFPIPVAETSSSAGQAAVPEPGSVALLAISGLALGGLAVWRRLVSQR
jgi:autotransporter-associated beta strand protein